MENNSGKRIAIFLYYQGSLKFHPSVVNSAALWIQNGFKVDIFKCYNNDEGIDVTDDFNVIHASKYRSNPVLRIVSLLHFIKNAGTYTKNRAYKALIGIDAYGLIIAGIVNSILNVPVIYFSLELLTKKFNYISLKQKKIFEKTGYILHHTLTKLLERHFHKKALFTVIQDAQRWKILKEINRMSQEADVIYVPNSPLKDDTRFIEDNSYLRNKYNIPKDKKIVLYAGSLGEWTGIDKVLDNMNSWPEDVFFVVHGRGNPGFMKKLEEEVYKYGAEKVILSKEQLTEKDFNTLVQSADIGLAWYFDKEDPNVYTIGAASGKLFYYFKYGLPVVTNRWPGLIDIVEGNKAGICADSEELIGVAISKILDNYDYYSKSSMTCFEHFEFSRHFGKVIDAISGI